MAIILEGPDNAGKSTLAKALSEAMGWNTIHAGGPPKNEAETKERLHTDFDLMQRKMIMDRSFIISETVFGPITRNIRSFDPKPWFRKMQSLDIHDETFHLLICLPPESVVCNQKVHIIKPHETKEHVDAMLAKQKQIYAAYASLANVMGLFMDISVVDPREHFDEIVADIALWYGDK